MKAQRANKTYENRRAKRHQDELRRAHPQFFFYMTQKYPETALGETELTRFMGK